jgi:hypothetical protein
LPHPGLSPLCQQTAGNAVSKTRKRAPLLVCAFMLMPGVAHAANDGPAPPGSAASTVARIVLMPGVAHAANDGPAAACIRGKYGRQDRRLGRAHHKLAARIAGQRVPQARNRTGMADCIVEMAADHSHSAR